MNDSIEVLCEREWPNMSHKGNFGLASRCDEKCEAVAHQRIEVDTPVKIEVVSRSKRVRVECCKPIICGHSEPECHRKSSCEFVVKQFIDVRIPICYHVKTKVGESYVKCKGNHDC